MRSAPHGMHLSSMCHSAAMPVQGLGFGVQCLAPRVGSVPPRPVSAIEELSWSPCSSMSCSVPGMDLLSRSSPLGSLQAHKLQLTASDW